MSWRPLEALALFLVRNKGLTWNAGGHICFLEITDQIGSGILPQNDTAMLKMKE